MDKVWFITGAGRGIGREIVQAALAAGDRVVATSRSGLPDSAGLAPAEALLALDLDVTDHGAVERAVATAVERFGRIDVLVNNAGYSQLGALEECTLEQIETQFATNVFGLAAVLKAVLPIMRGQGGGHVFNFSSVAGVRSSPGCGIYGATKFAVEGLSGTLALDAAPFGIKVTIVEPGSFRTGFLGGASSFAPAAPIPDYERTVAGDVRRYVAALDGTQEGDPAKLARAIVQLSQMPDPPLWFTAGADAVGAVETMLHQRHANLEAMRALSSSLAIDG